MKKMISHEPKWLKVTFVVLLFSLTILAVAVATLFYFGGKREGEFVSKDHVQAVFLTNGQVYFGKIQDITNQYVDLQDVYYLNSQQQPSSDSTAQAEATQQSTFSLVKLGCELHGPADQMIINRDQISFWENLHTKGKVSKAIDQWRSQNPDGQDCEKAAAEEESDTTTNSKKEQQ